MSTIQFRRGTAAEWTFVNPILQAGEPGLETDTRRVKVGSGVDRWSDLQYTASEAVGVDWTSITSLPSSFAPSAHASSHASSGGDAISPSDIGAAPASSPVFTGVITVSTGTASAPSIVASGDSATGLSFATDTLIFSTAGTERLRVTANGDVGIGVVPTTNYMIDAASPFGIARYRITDSTKSARMILGEVGLAGDFRAIFYGSGIANSNTVGLVGPGGAAWSLNTGGDIAFTTTGSGGINLQPGRNTASQSPTLYVSPDYQIQVQGQADPQKPEISFWGDTDSGVFRPAADTVAISTAGTEHLRVNSNGSIGVGFAGSPSVGFRQHWKHTGNNYISHLSSPQIYSGAAVSWNFWTAPSLKDSDYAYSGHTHFVANPIPSIPSGSTMGTEQAYVVGNSIQAWTVQGFVGKLNLVAGQTRHNVYCSGSAPNYFAGSVGIGVADPSGALDVNSDKIRLRTAKTPASASDTGNAGDICWDSSYIYVCVATNTWRRIAHSTW